MKEGMKCRILYARMRLKKLKKERKINNHPPSHFILDYSKLPEQLPAICFEWARSQWRHKHTSFWLKINEDECVVYYNAYWGSIIPQRDLRRFSDSFMRKTAGRENKFDRLTFQSDACGGPLVLMGHHTGTYFSLICSRFQTFVSVLHESNCAVVGYTRTWQENRVKSTLRILHGNHQNYEAGNNKCAKTASREESQVILTEPVPEFWPTCCLKKM